MNDKNNTTHVMSPQQIANELAKPTLRLDALHVSDPVHITSTRQTRTSTCSQDTQDTDQGRSMTDFSVASSLSSRYAQAMTNPTPFSTPIVGRDAPSGLLTRDNLDLGECDLALMFGEVEEAVQMIENEGNIALSSTHMLGSMTGESLVTNADTITEHTNGEYKDTSNALDRQEEYYECIDDYDGAESTRERTLSMYSVHSLDPVDSLWVDS